MEILRRLFLVAGVVLSLWWALVPKGPLVAVKAVDFAEEQRDRPGWSEDRKMTPEQFVAEETKDRRFDADPAAWKAVSEAARALSRGDAVPSPFSGRVGKGSILWTALYLDPAADPLPSMRPALSEDRPVAYVAVPAAGGKTTWLLANWKSPKDARGIEPSSLLFPRRPLAPWPILAALALYVVLPRPKRTKETATYSRVRAAILPDVLGVLVTGMFVALPLFVIPANAPSGDVFDPGWRPLVWIGAAMACFGLAIFAAAAWYASLSFTVEEGGIRRATLFGSRWIPFAEIAEVRSTTVRAPRSLVGLLLLFGFANPRLLGQGLILAGRSDEAVEIVLRSGRRIRVMLTGLENSAALSHALTTVPAARAPVAG